MKEALKWIVGTVLIAMICAGIVLYIGDQSKQTADLGEQKRIADLAASLLARHQAALDELANVTTKAYQTEAERMIREIKALKDELVSLKHDLRQCVGEKKERP